MTTPRYVEQRERVMLGSLPEDFLRVESPDSRDSPTAAHSQTRQATQTQQQQNHAQANMTAQITLSVIGAQLAKNYSITKMDPYVRIRIGHAVFETQTDVRGGKFPSWNKTITAYLPTGIRTIHIEIFDENTLTPDERIAYADYVLTDEALQGKFVDTWVPLSGKQGEGKEGSINITICIRSVPYWSPVMPSAAPLMVYPQPAMGIWPYYVGGQPVSILPQPLQNPNFPPPVQPQPNYQPSEDDIKQLQEMFPSYDKEVIVGVLENFRGNKDQAITSLLSLGDK